MQFPSFEMMIADKQSAYKHLFEENSNLIFKLINNFVRSKNIRINKHDVDDIYQEVALKIYKNDYLSKYKEQKSSFLTWLNIICRTTAIDYYRKQMRWMESVLNEKTLNDDDALQEPLEFSLPSGVLTKRQTEVITLFFKEGLDTGEIATRLGITSRTVRSIKFQALERIRNNYRHSSSLPSDRRGAEQRRKVS